MAEKSQAFSVFKIICNLNKKIKTKSEKIKDVCYDTSSYRQAKAAVKAAQQSITITISGLKKPDENTTSPCARVVDAIEMFELNYKAEGRQITNIKYDKDSCEKAKVKVKAEDTSIIITIDKLKKAD